jgi:hypothetical protein
MVKSSSASQRSRLSWLFQNATTFSISACTAVPWNGAQVGEVTGRRGAPASLRAICWSHGVPSSDGPRRVCMLRGRLAS